jgi:hypothetical protein
MGVLELVLGSVCLEACAVHCGCLLWMARGEGAPYWSKCLEQLSHPCPLCREGEPFLYLFLHVQLCLTMAGIHCKWLFSLLSSRCLSCQCDVLLPFLEFIRKIQLYQLCIIKRVRFYLKFKYSLIGFNLFVLLLNFLKNSFVESNFPKCLLERGLTGAKRTPELINSAHSFKP